METESQVEDDTLLTVHRPASAAPERVWDLWTTSGGLAQWWWPNRFQTNYTVNAEDGGSFHFVTAPVEPFGVLDLSGDYLEVSQPELLSFTWKWAEDTEPTMVRVTFRTTDAGTSIEVHHAGFPSAEERDNHIAGWNDCLDRLEQFLKSGEPQI
jgi:uncharacterized protein YndB with AHSA1/START domain